MNDDVTARADTISRVLAQRDTDPNELAKVATYLRTHLDGASLPAPGYHGEKWPASGAYRADTGLLP